MSLFNSLPKFSVHFYCNPVGNWGTDCRYRVFQKSVLEPRNIPKYLSIQKFPQKRSHLSNSHKKIFILCLDFITNIKICKYIYTLKYFCVTFFKYNFECTEWPLFWRHIVVSYFEIIVRYTFPNNAVDGTDLLAYWLTYLLAYVRIFSYILSNICKLGRYSDINSEVVVNQSIVVLLIYLKTNIWVLN